MSDLTQVTITLDQHSLQTIKMGLAALQLNAVAIEASIDRQVQQQLQAAQQPPAPPAAPDAAKRTNGAGAHA
jgi:hypothetical protein